MGATIPTGCRKTAGSGPRGSRTLGSTRLVLLDDPAHSRPLGCGALDYRSKFPDGLSIMRYAGGSQFAFYIQKVPRDQSVLAPQPRAFLAVWMHDSSVRSP